MEVKLLTIAGLPPPAVKTVRDLLFWQYAKIISNSAGEGKGNYGSNGRWKIGYRLSLAGILSFGIVAVLAAV